MKRVRVRRRSGRRTVRALAASAAALLVIAVVAAAVAALRPPSGLARVDGRDVTEQDLLAEARARKVPLSTNRPALLRAVVDRELLVAEARRRKLDRRPSQPSDRRRALDAQLAGALIDSTPPPAAPSSTEIDAYIAQHPDGFALRRRYILDGLSFAATADPVSAGLSWDDLERKLVQANIAHRRDAYVYQSGDLPAQLRAALPRTAVGGLISVSGGGQVDVYRLLASDPAPLTGAAAVVEARRALQRQAREAQVARLLESLDHRVDVRLGTERPAPRDRAAGEPR